MKFLFKIITLATQIAPWRNALVLAAIFLSSVSTIVAPFLLGQGVASLAQTEGKQEFLWVALWLAVSYSLVWFVGSTLRHLILPHYAIIEQKLQSEVMAKSLVDSLKAEPELRRAMDNGELSFAIDSEAGAYRDSLSSLYLSCLPAGVSLIAGLAAVTIASSWIEGALLAIAVVVYSLLSKKLIEDHKAAQANFFKENMRSFGVLSNSLALWKEAVVYSSEDFLGARYRQDRVPVEEAGQRSYSATRRLHVAQGLILAVAILALIVAISLRAQSGGPHVIGAIVSTVGITVAAISPLQTLGFGISALAVAVAQESEAGRKIRPAGSHSSGDSSTTANMQELIALIRSQSVQSGQSPQSAQPEGRPIWVLGPSGAGKTTLLEGLLGLNSAAGSGPDFSGDRGGYAQQSSELLHADAIENVIFGRTISRDDASDALVEVGLESFAVGGADHSRDVAGEDGRVSGGERQRISVARAMCGDSAGFVVLDEPTSGLDSSTKARVWRFIEEQAQRRLIIVATHDEAAPIGGDDKVFRLSPRADERADG